MQFFIRIKFYCISKIFVSGYDKHHSDVRFKFVWSLQWLVLERREDPTLLRSKQIERTHWGSLAAREAWFCALLLIFFFLFLIDVLVYWGFWLCKRCLFWQYIRSNVIWIWIFVVSQTFSFWIFVVFLAVWWWYSATFKLCLETSE